MRRSRMAALAIVAYSVVSVVIATALAELSPAAPSDLHLPRTIVFAVSIIGFGITAALIVDRRPDHPVGWVLAFAAVAEGLTNAAAGYAAFALYRTPLPGGDIAAWIFSWTYALALGPVVTLLPLYFPTGRLPTRAWRPVAAAGLLGTIGFASMDALLPAPLVLFTSTPKPVALTESGDLVMTLLVASVSMMLVAALGAAASLIQRARSSSTSVERQQLKWFGYAVAVVTATLLIVTALGLSAVVTAEVITYATLTIPVAVAIAILRYRLYEIDLLINRTLVYGPLTALLLGTYAALVIALQAVLRPLTGGSEIAVAASTLGVVALVQPLRHRIQAAVDRRFYRARYDAAHALDGFTARMRDEVDIDAVRGDVLDVVHETLQPAQAGIWLRGR